MERHNEDRIAQTDIIAIAWSSFILSIKAKNTFFQRDLSTFTFLAHKKHPDVEIYTASFTPADIPIWNRQPRDG